ncbi:hypothetical protein AALA52_02495 [Lactococcus ileimucosae]|uniref:Uncharacterized protein n=1 Tax=Lactococcus ileimucosae TaxID=2941329 RepID=A0ABV4D0N6_9LACT
MIEINKQVGKIVVSPPKCKKGETDADKSNKKNLKIKKMSLEAMTKSPKNEERLNHKYKHTPVKLFLRFVLHPLTHYLCFRFLLIKGSES